jgi:hypothetical protein
MSILEDVKSLVSTIQKIDNIELHKQIISLQGEVVQLFGENVELKASLAKAQGELSARRTLRFEHNAYWSGESLETSDGPFCAKCWDTKQQQVRMLVMRNAQWSKCHVCDISLKLPRRENGFDKTPDDTPLVSVVSTPRRNWDLF